MQRHRDQQFTRFLNAVEAEVPAGKVIHVVLGNYAVHKHPVVRRWLDRHPRWTFHFTPTSCSWLNAVEGFFAKLSKRRLKRGVFNSIMDLQAAINRFLAEHSAESRPFKWTEVPENHRRRQARAPIVRFDPLAQRSSIPSDSPQRQRNNAVFHRWIDAIWAECIAGQSPFGAEGDTRSRFDTLFFSGMMDLAYPFHVRLAKIGGARKSRETDNETQTEVLATPCRRLEAIYMAGHKLISTTQAFGLRW